MKLYDNQVEIKSKKDLRKVIKSNEILFDIIIKGDDLIVLEDVSKLYGSVCFCDCHIESLGILREVIKNFSISSNSVKSKLTSLSTLEKVGGDLILRYSNIENLGSLKYVGGKVSLRDTKVSTLGFLRFVGGDLFLPKRLKGLDLSNIEVKGNIKYWEDSYIEVDSNMEDRINYINFNNPIAEWSKKYISSYSEIFYASNDQKEFYSIFKEAFLKGQYIDLKNNDNYSFILLYDLIENIFSKLEEQKTHLEKLSEYYPITKYYCDSIISEKLENIGNYEGAWNQYIQNYNLDIERIFDFSLKLNRDLINEDIIFRVGGINHLTDFGQRNFKDISPFVKMRLKDYLCEKDTTFINIFIKSSKPINKLDFDSTNFIEFEPEFYKTFFNSEIEYEMYKSFDIEQKNSGYNRPISHVFEKSIISQFKIILKDAEDLYRETIGMPKIGEGWISETELFYKITKYFANEVVLHHASPDWLGRQHLDIYIPKFNIGIEYQGVQHFEPIDFFGGEEGFIKTVERDKRKRELCINNNCYLIYVNNGYSLNEVITEIEQLINSLK